MIDILKFLYIIFNSYYIFTGTEDNDACCDKNCKLRRNQGAVCRFVKINNNCITFHINQYSYDFNSIIVIKILHVVWDVLTLHPEPFVEKQHMPHVNVKPDAQVQLRRVLGHRQSPTVPLVLKEVDVDVEDACRIVKLKECKVACVTLVCVFLLCFNSLNIILILNDFFCSR